MFAKSSGTATLAQTSASAACVATLIPWVIDSFNHMTNNVSILSDVYTSHCLPRVTLTDSSTSKIDGLSTASLSSSISLFSMYLVPKFLFNLLYSNVECSVSFFPIHCVF